MEGWRPLLVGIDVVAAGEAYRGAFAVFSGRVSSRSLANLRSLNSSPYRGQRRNVLSLSSRPTSSDTSGLPLAVFSRLLWGSRDRRRGGDWDNGGLRRYGYPSVRRRSTDVHRQYSWVLEHFVSLVKVPLLSIC